jgi:hypothetical protein
MTLLPTAVLTRPDRVATAALRAAHRRRLAAVLAHRHLHRVPPAGDRRPPAAARAELDPTPVAVTAAPGPGSRRGVAFLRPVNLERARS